MGDETFVYKCPSCGGKVTFLEDILKWKCDFCGNKYDALFVPRKSVDLTNMNDIKYTFYCYECDNCHAKFLSKDKENATCTKCKHECKGQGKETTVSKVIDLDYTVSEANIIYYKEVDKFKKFLDSEYLKQDLKLEYINCDLYNGCVKITSSAGSKKYIFMNLLIPNIEYNDYRFMYEVGNIGIKNSKTYSKDKQETMENKIRQKLSFFTNVDDINYVNDIVEACLKDYKRNYKVDDAKVENNLSVSDGVYFPIYKKSINKDNQYVFGNNSAMKPSILQFPEEKNSRAKVKNYNSLSKLATGFIVLSFLGIIGSFQIEVLLVPIFILTLIISIVLYSQFNKKYNYYLKTIKMTKEDYFNQIISNSNYVKGIKVK